MSDSKPREGHDKASLYVSIFSMAIALAAFGYGIYNAKQIKLAREDTNKITAYSLIEEAWDALGGEPFAKNITELTDDPQDFKRAYDLIRKAEKLIPEDPRWHGILGHYLYTQGRLVDALSAYDRAIELDPENGAAHNNRGIALQKLDRLDEALAAFDRAIELEPENGAAHNNRGIILEKLDRLEEALAAYDRAIELDLEDGLPKANRD